MPVKLVPHGRHALFLRGAEAEDRFFVHYSSVLSVKINLYSIDSTANWVQREDAKDAKFFLQMGVSRRVMFYVEHFGTQQNFFRAAMFYVEHFWTRQNLFCRRCSTWNNFLRARKIFPKNAL